MSKIVAKYGDNGIKYWTDFGGDLSALKRAIRDGSGKKRIFGAIMESESRNELTQGYDGLVNIGEPVTIATAIATATPIILKYSKVLEQFKDVVDSKVVQDGISLAKTANDGFKKLTGENITDVVFKQEKGVTTNKSVISENDLQSLTGSEAEKIAQTSVALASGLSKNDVVALQSSTPQVFNPQFPKTLLTNIVQSLKNYTTPIVIGSALVIGYLLIGKKKR